MITKRVWIKERYRKGRRIFDAHFTHQPYEGWYLFGILPLYIRARGPEKDRHSGANYGLR